MDDTEHSPDENPRAQGLNWHSNYQQERKREPEVVVAHKVGKAIVDLSFVVMAVAVLSAFGVMIDESNQFAPEWAPQIAIAAALIISGATIGGILAGIGFLLRITAQNMMVNLDT